MHNLQEVDPVPNELELFPFPPACSCVLSVWASTQSRMLEIWIQVQACLQFLSCVGVCFFFLYNVLKSLLMLFYNPRDKPSICHRITTQKCVKTAMKPTQC